jgi:3-deoxy-7-phosphoheptulonate synthase
MPIGFKNATDGDVQVAIDGVTVAAQQHTTFGIDDEGRAAIVTTRGNGAGHVILRGGRFGPNYGTHNVIYSARLLARAGLSPRIIVDASHANSGKSHIRQLEVAHELAAQIADGEPIAGVMVESFIEPGAQKLTDAGLEGLVYGKSITDACIGWDDTEALLEDLAAAARRAARLEPVDV